MRSCEILSFLVAGIIATVIGAPQGGYNYNPNQAPQGGYNYPRPTNQYQPAPAQNQYQPPSNQYQPQPQQPELVGGSSNGQGQFAQNQFGGGGNRPQGGNLQVECKRQESSPGRYKFVCDGVNPEAISLRSEHILWLTGPEGQKQVLDIEVPNYKIEELIKAGFKNTPGGGTSINVLLRRPEQSYDAQIDTITPAGGIPNVNLQYEPVEKTLVHFPNDKPYSPLQGPILPPLNGGRGRRQY